jgi:hypothetical protein
MQSNQLLASLRRKDQLQLIAACDVVDLCIGDILSEPQSRIRHVYFPLDSFISQLVPIDSRENLELALIGNEGMLGTPLVLGVNSSTLQALVQGSGTALRMSAASFRRELEQLPAFRKQLLRYVGLVALGVAGRWLVGRLQLEGPGAGDHVVRRCGSLRRRGERREHESHQECGRSLHLQLQGGRIGVGLPNHGEQGLLPHPGFLPG